MASEESVESVQPTTTIHAELALRGSEEEKENPFSRVAVGGGLRIYERRRPASPSPLRLSRFLPPACLASLKDVHLFIEEQPRK